MNIKTVSLGLALLFALSSCSPVRDLRTLEDLEALMPQRADSVLAVLRGMTPHDMPGLHVRPLHALLLSEGYDKNYVDLTDDSLAMAANRYYGSHGPRLRRLKSWYYLGRIRFNSGNYAEAVICYNKAMKYAEQLGDYHYLGLINREIANAYSSVLDDHHAIGYIEESVSAFEFADEPRYTAFSRLALARLYRKESLFEQSDSVLSVMLNTVSEDYLRASCHELMALNMVSEGVVDRDRIMECYRKAGIGTVLPATPNRLSDYAYIHQLCSHPDSADYYMAQAVSGIVSQQDSIYVLYNQQKIAEDRSEYRKANALFHLRNTLQDPFLNKTLEQSVSFYQGQYYLNESKVSMMKTKIHTLSSGILILSLIMVVFLLAYRNRRQRERIISAISQTSEIRKELSMMQDSREELGHAVAALFENRLNIIQAISDKYALVEQVQGNSVKEKNLNLSRDEIISSFRSAMLSLRKDKEINMSMESVLDAWKDGIMRRLHELCGENGTSNVRLTSEDLKLAPYYFSGMHPKAISYLTGYSYDSLRVRKTRIKHKIQGMDNSFSVDRDFFLQNFQ